MEGALGCWLSATRTPEGGWQLQWQAGDGKEGDFVALCPLGSASASECVARQPVKGAERSAMWLLDAPDCEQLLCFRYYDAETDTCLAESEALRPAPECNGIENGAFRDDAPPGANGAKRKVRAKGDQREYFQIWAAHSSPEEEEEGREGAPPLPPRALHRPLERSHALAGAPFPFDIVDLDDQLSASDNYVSAALSKSFDAAPVQEGEAESRPHRPLARLANPEPVRPHPKALSRVAGLSSALPMCPPTPTHHARKNRCAE
ncbi:uncharacterized protein LOC125503066, partial [Dendroctonus ponderosae]|uniref:uncharacterized protein LOC125503066 n=1 Tax=Dendroctonus ponderosae TaxID=77166 RepID=UPI0020355DF5